MSIARQFGYEQPNIVGKAASAESGELKLLRERVRELERENAELRAAKTVTPVTFVTPTVTPGDGIVTRNANAERQRRYRERRKSTNA